MPYNIEAVEGKGITITYSGILDDTEFRKIDKELLSLVNSDKYFTYILIDASKLEGNQVSAAVIKDSASNAREMTEQKEIDTEIIFVTPNDLDYGLARMWSSFFQDGKKECHLFRSMEEAEELISTLTS